MRKADDVIPVIESLVSQMTPVVTITSNTADGDNWLLTTCRTYWIHKGMTITIGGETFVVEDFEFNTSITVSGDAQPVGVTFTLDAPTFWHGSRRKVNAEQGEILDQTNAKVYLPIPRVREVGGFESDIAYVANIRPIFMLGYDVARDTIELQQDEIIQPCNEMADFFLWLIDDQDGNFNEVEDVDRYEWMNFGDETVWGKDRLIFNQNLSGVQLTLDLDVLSDNLCECDATDPITCAPARIFINGTYEDEAPSGEDFELIVVDTNGDPQGTYDEPSKTITVPADGGGGVASQTYNGTSVTDQASGTTKVITVKDSAGSNVGTKVTDTALALAITIDDVTVDNSDVSFTVDIPAEGVYVLPDITVTDSDGSSSAYPSAKNVTCTPMFPSSKLWKTGQTTSYAANDDGDLERGNGASFTTLSKNNYFGNTNRFTDVLGGQTYTDDWVIDWSTWDKETGEYIMWYRVKQPGKTWANTISGQPYNLGGYSDCYIPNINELRSLYNFNLTSCMGYSPINITASGGSANNLWTSTTVPTATTTAMAFNDVVIEQARAKTLVVQYIVLRIGNVSEL